MGIITCLIENASFRFPGGHCGRTDFITDFCGDTRKVAAEAKDAAEAKAKADGVCGGVGSRSGRWSGRM